MMRDLITGESSAPDTRYREHPGGVSSEYVWPSGAIRCYATDDEGYLVTMQYFGYTRREAVTRFREDARDYWERVGA